MPENPAVLYPADYRRAAALIVHFQHGDTEGVAAVLGETSEDGRPVSLILAVLQVYAELVPELRSELGISLMTSSILRMAGMESDAGGDRS